MTALWHTPLVDTEHLVAQRAIRLSRPLILLLLVTMFFGACGPEANPTPSTTPLPTAVAAPSSTAIPPATASPSATVTTRVPTDAPATPTETTVVLSPTPSAPPTVSPLTGCRLGTGLNLRSAPIILANSEQPALVMAPNYRLAETYFPDLEGWIRVLGAPSLDLLEQRAQRAQQSGLAYEALGYGLEAGKSTPEEEWLDIVAATEQARDVADRYDKLLVMGPGFRLMSENEDKYPAMAALSDIWILQTQRLQILGAGELYRQEVERIVDLIRAGNPNIQIWAQITLLPDRDPDAEEWLTWRHAIDDLVDGTYLGVYLWGRVDEEQLVATIEGIFSRACSPGP